jgi:ABC-2 type transport system permease protein
MRQFYQVFRFELLNYLRKKVFLVLTLVLVIAIGVVLSFPRITELFGSGETEPGGEVQKTMLALCDRSGADPEATRDYLNAALPGYDFQLVEATDEALQGDVQAGKYPGAVVIEEPLKFRYIVNNLNLTDQTQALVGEALTQKYRTDAMEAAGLSAEEAQSLLTAVAEGEAVQSGNDQMSSVFYTYILMMLLYMAILLYGQFVASGVATEKSSRAMELLITSSKPTSLIFGKVIGIGSAGLLQLVVLLLSAFGFYNLNKGYWADVPLMASLFDMPVSIMLYTILFFVLGFFIYAFLFGALASLASRMEDVNTLVMPVVFLFVAAFLIVMYSLGSGNVDTPLMVACSYIPFTSPMAMFTRIAMGNVAAYEIVISVAILVVSTIGVGVLSSAIYRIGVLLYGKPPKLSAVFRMLRKNV